MVETRQASLSISGQESLLVGSILRVQWRGPQRILSCACERPLYKDAFMRAVLQRVSRAQVRQKPGPDRSDGQILGKVGRGFVVLLGVARDDTEADAAHLADRILGIRV